MKIRGRSLQCEACGENAALTEKQFQQIDYEMFTQTSLSTVCFLLGLYSLVNWKIVNYIHKKLEN